MKRVALAAVVLLVVSLFVLPAAAQYFQLRTVLDEPGIDQNTLARLMSGGQVVVVRENAAGRMSMITAGVLINRPPATVWQTVTDFANYPKFMPSVAECQIMADSGNVKDIRYKLRFKFLIFSFSANYVLRTYFKPADEMTWNLLSCEDNKIRQTYGSWRFFPIGGGKQTAAFYSVYSDITNVVPGLGSFIKKDPSMEVAINSSSCLMVVKALKSRSENPSWVQAQ